MTLLIKDVLVDRSDDSDNDTGYSAAAFAHAFYTVIGGIGGIGTINQTFLFM